MNCLVKEHLGPAAVARVLKVVIGHPCGLLYGLMIMRRFQKTGISVYVSA